MSSSVGTTAWEKLVYKLYPLKVALAPRSIGCRTVVVFQGKNTIFMSACRSLLTQNRSQFSEELKYVMEREDILYKK